MRNPVTIVPQAMQALHALGKASAEAVPQTTIDLMHLRVSQLNGCSVCVDMHARDLKRSGETDERLFAVAAWRDAPYFTDAERAALALAESLTRLSGGEGVSDEIWIEATRHYDERAMSSLLLSIAVINVWNRLNVATRQVAGEWLKAAAAR
jgi:AhpD family alkylhydroperoxidase